MRRNSALRHFFAFQLVLFEASWAALIKLIYEADKLEIHTCVAVLHNYGLQICSRIHR